MCIDLPRDIIKQIIKLCDIDSRRALGIYCKLDVPQKLKVLLKQIPKINNDNNFIKVELGPFITVQLYNYSYEYISLYTINKIFINNFILIVVTHRDNYDNFIKYYTNI
jgi:hypothetical protein